MGLIAREATRADIARRFSYCSHDERAAWAEVVEGEFDTMWETGGLFGVALDGNLGPTEAISIAGFLREDFSRHVVSMPAPYVNAVTCEWIRAGRNPLLPSLDRDPAEFAAEAAGEGVHLHLFDFHWEGPLDDPATLGHRAYLSQALTERYIGCPLRLLTVEVHPNALDSVLRGGFVIANDFPKAPANDRVKLCGVDRSVANRSSQFWLMHAFAPGKPRVPLSHRQRRILFHFRAGLSDSEIAERVFLSPKSMKTNWDRIFEVLTLHVSEFAEVKSKRKLLSDYLRTHPEEVWPCLPQESPRPFSAISRSIRLN